MVKKNKFFTKRKILLMTMGSLTTSGIIAIVLITVLNKQQNTTNIKNKEIKNDDINKIQKIYKLESKKEKSIKILPKSNLKTRYESAAKISELIFANRDTHDTLFKYGTEKTTNLKQTLLIMTPKKQTRSTSDGKWPLNEIDSENDQLAVLITFFKNKVVKVENKLPDKPLVNKNIIFFKLKEYDMIQLLYKFKNTDFEITDFGDYNLFLDNDEYDEGLNNFKKYLLSLKANDSQVKESDLTGANFRKINHNEESKMATAELSFIYKDLLATKIINNFKYENTYRLSLKTAALNKVADEVVKADIDTTNLPDGIVINTLEPSSKINDGTTIRVTFNQGKIKEQEISGLTSYQSIAEKILKNTLNTDFTIPGKSDIFASEYNDKNALLEQLKLKTNTISNENVKRKIKNILEKAIITFEPDDKTGVLRFTISIGKSKKTFSIDNFVTIYNITKVNQKIDAEVKKMKLPKIKTESIVKNCSKIRIEDFVITADYPFLMLKIINFKEIVEKWSGDDLIICEFEAEVEVSANVEDADKTNYKITKYKVKFQSVGLKVNLLIERAIQIINNKDFTFNDKAKILPSEFKNNISIKNDIKKQIDILSDEIGSNDEIDDATKETIDKYSEITFNPDDKNGILRFKFKFVNIEKEFEITGFRRSS